jgi:C-terminal processing protease CtpA/Prc
MSSSIKSEKVNHITLDPFWEHNQTILKQLARKNMPSKSRLIYKQISTDHNETQDSYSTYYDMINIYDNRKHFIKISAEFTKDLNIKQEEIVAGNNPSEGKKTILNGDKITNVAHREWLKEMFRNNSHQLFRA